MPQSASLTPDNTNLSFAGRTAIITGSGGNPGLGRAYALLLASRGAQVVVNDIAANPDAVVAEITKAGGKAVADHHSVSTAEGAAAIVQTALQAFGAVDILINNAAVSIAAPLMEMTEADFRRHIDVNVLGTYHLSRAVWPIMQAQGYGRIINATSAAMTGFARQTAYATSKGAIWSFTRSLAAEATADIKVNAISPGAYTLLAASMMEDDSPLLEYSRAHLPAELAAPVAAYLAHESCTLNGECLDGVGGHVQRTFVGRTKGFADAALTPEMVARRMANILEPKDADIIGIANFDTASWKLKPYQAGE